MTTAADKPILYHSPQTRSSTALWMLEELGVGFDVKLVNMKKDEQRGPAHLAVNPMGKVPVLQHDGVTITEGGAICTYLADAFPQAGLAPAIGDPLRGPYLMWMFFSAGCLEPALIDRALKREPGRPGMMPYGDVDTTIEVVAKALAKGPWFLGNRFSAVDVYVGSGIRWTTLFGILPKRPEFTDYLARLEARPALLRAIARDAEWAAQHAQG